MNEFWKGRGYPWEYDPGPPKNRKWPRLFAETPNYRQLGKSVLGREKFRWHFGPMFYRGRLRDNAVKVLVIGQEGAQDESLAHRSFTGGTGARMQYFLNYIGITQSYLFLNTFVYPIFGQYNSSLRWLAQNPESPIVQHRHEIFDYVLAKNDLRLVIAVGNAAKESVVTWVEEHGGQCPAGATDVSRCIGSHLDPHTKIVGVKHPGGAGQGGAISAIIADFKRALRKIEGWIEDDPSWLPPDADCSRQFDEPYKYRSAPIPFRDFAYGVPLRLGRGGTSSNRKDSQRSIQIYSADGAYNNRGVKLTYPDTASGSVEGYADDLGDLPYEPPKKNYRQYDKGPGVKFARLFMGGSAGLAWPDFKVLGLNAHLSFGHGPIYRGRPDRAEVLVLADQQSHDDLLTGRALAGEAGQHLQAFLQAVGIDYSYVILRVLPIDSLAVKVSVVRAVLDHPQTQKVYQAIVGKILGQKRRPHLCLTFGPHAHALRQHLDINNLPVVNLKAWHESGALQDWQSKLNTIQQLAYKTDIANPTFTYNGSRGQIPRYDLPYGTLRWQGTSGDRGRQAVNKDTQKLSPDYYKLYMPVWASKLKPKSLSKQEQKAVDKAP